jgi:hypothetical protein
MNKYVIICLFSFFSFTSKAQSLKQATWQQHVDYVIEVKLDDINHLLAGDIVITYTNNSPQTLSEVYIHLWPNAYKNNSTAFAKQMQENGDLDFYYAKESDRGSIDQLEFMANGMPSVMKPTNNIDVVSVQLTKPIKTGEKVTLSTPFRVKVPKVFSRLGHENQDYFITQWYPKPAVYDVNGWNAMPYLNQGEFYSEFGSFKVSITVPDNYVVVATGECENELELGESKIASDTFPVSSAFTKTLVFKADKVHDFAWFASKRWGYVTKKIRVGENDVLARMVSPEPDKKYLNAIETAITYYSDNVGVYPYSHATVVYGELKAGGGMEYPMITLCDFLNEEVIVHEVGHNWFYGILANNERRFPWMDESINSYYEAEAMKNGKEDKADLNSGIMMALVKDNLLRNEHQAIGTSSELLTAGNYGMSVYGIGAKSIGYLKAYLGDEVYLSCMTSYYEKWKFKHPLPDDMKVSFEQTSGKDLNWFFRDLINMEGKLDFAISARKDGYHVINKSSITAPFPIQSKSTIGIKEVKWYMLKSGESMLISDMNQNKLLIDPKSETIDLFKGNNSSNAKWQLKAFTGADKPETKEIYVVPALGWNAYDKMMVGVGLHNYAISDKALQYYVMPMYSFEQKVITGSAGLTYIKTLEKPSQYIEFGVNAKRFSFLNRRENLVLSNDGYALANYSYLKAKPYVVYYFPKKNLRSQITKNVMLAVDQVFFKPQFDFISNEVLPGPFFSKSRSNSFITLTYSAKNTRKINGSSFVGNAEYGRLTEDVVIGKKVQSNSGLDSFYANQGTNVNGSDFAKISGVYRYGLDIGIQDKPLEIRVYGAVMLKKSNSDQYNNQLGGYDKAGYYDYKFDDYLMHRNATYGLFQNQINGNANASKFVGPISSSNKWLVSSTITVPLPGKIPFKPYVEIVLFDDIATKNWNSSGTKFIYNVGVEVEIVKDRFEVFFNLAQSSDVTNYQDGTNGGLIQSSSLSKFTDRITFVFDLNNLTPSKLKKQLKLF